MEELMAEKPVTETSKKNKQKAKQQQRNATGNQTWALKMHDDEQIDFEQVLAEEQRKQQE